MYLYLGVVVSVAPIQSARAGALPDVLNGQPLPSMAPVLSGNRRRVDRVAQVDAIAERYPDEVLLLIQRGQRTQLVHLKR